MDGRHVAITEYWHAAVDIPLYLHLSRPTSWSPAHPAVLRLIKNVIENGHNAGIWVGMCGEMAGDIIMTIILLGLGLDEFSTSPIAIPEIKRIIRSVTLRQAKEIAQEAISLPTGKEIEKFAKKRLTEIVPDLAIEVE